tara:strand:- start:150 stop:686 length:537 start_codon:yes stop_codon:yes gene_type:complete
MGFLSNTFDFFAGNANLGDMTNTLNQGMGDYTSGLQGVAGQLGKLGQEATTFGSGTNVAQRGLLQDAASQATAMGGMQAQRMAAQQGMGGSGLLQQAQQNQAYSNMMGAGQKGLGAFLQQQKLGGGYLQAQGQALSEGGKMQSEMNVNQATAMSDNAANRGALGQQLAGTAFGMMFPG